MRNWIFILLLFISGDLFSQSFSVMKLKCENEENPLGVEATQPLFSWQLLSNGRGILQKAYRIIISKDISRLKNNNGEVWDSKKTLSDQSINIQYSGKTLVPANTYYWKVMTWDNKGHQSAWSKISYFQVGIFKKDDWAGAKWIAYEKIPDSLITIPAEHGKGSGKGANVKEVLPIFRKEFALKSPVARATIFICGLGHFDLSVNGKKIGDHFLDPGWTKYDKEALYVPFDVTNNLKKGINVLGVQLGNGLYFMPRHRYRKHTGAFGFPKLICRLYIEYKDGKTTNVISDQSWRTSSGPVTFSSIYGGEDYNASLEQRGWNTNSFNSTNWKQVVVVDGPPALFSQKADAVKIMDTLNPHKIKAINDRVYVYDLGQNASGIPLIKVKGKRGDTAKIIPGELLKEDGTVSQKATGSPVYFTYILKGEGIETWHPEFSYYGFRYLQLEQSVPRGYSNSKNTAVVLDLKGLHTRTAAEQVGTFSCSNSLFNRTRDLIDWSIRSNMQSVLTDCPHREKLGWLEQVHLMGNSIRYNYDILRYFKKTLSDIRTAQASDGSIPEYAPLYVIMDFMDGIFLESPEWGSAGVITPWYLYQWYGDVDVLRENYSMMKRYVSYLQTRAKENILSFGLGDWYDLGPARQGLAQLTPMGITATAIYYYDFNIMSQVAAVLGKSEESDLFAKKAKEVKEAFNKTFFNKEKLEYGTGSQTANAMAVYMNLVPSEFRQAVVDNIVRDIRKRNNSLTSGDIGYRYLLQVLQQEGRSDVIYDMNSRMDVPGYGYQIAKGATALTESWTASPLVSNNHLMLGHLMEWFYSALGGINQQDGSVGYKNISINPQLVRDINYVKSSYECPYGLIRSDWNKTTTSFQLHVQIPVNTTAIVYLPADTLSQVQVNNTSVTTNKNVIVQGTENGKLKVLVGSGSYIFNVSGRNFNERVVTKKQ